MSAKGLSRNIRWEITQKKRPGRFRLPGLGKWLWQSRALKLPLRRNKVLPNTSVQLTFLPLKLAIISHIFNTIYCLIFQD
ncbi:hypothetical protein OO9_04620 [Providencia alcalifaciens Dmel2]|nr:hypothetical protein OO9_04620 [Providencia alcalifaciens Dmel2]